MRPQITAVNMPDADDLASAYGDPHDFISELRDQHGNVSHKLDEPGWKATILSTVAVPFPSAVSLFGSDRPATRIFVHRRLFDSVSAILEEAGKTGAWKHVRNFAGCYSYRLMRGSARMLSVHSWAAALDFNAAPQWGPAVPGLYRLGDPPDPSDPFVREFIPIFQRHGWTWGGGWKRPDPMHVQATAGA